MEITHGLKEDGTLVYNGDEPLLNERAAEIDQRLVRFGRHLDDDLYATSVEEQPRSLTFTVNEWPDLQFTIPMVGEYNVNNALAAMAVGRLFHITPDRIKQALASVEAEWVTGENGEQILSDVYNSNPTAAKQVLKTVAEMPVEGRRIAVLGDMLELGEASARLHASLAAQIDPDKIQEVYLVGEQMAALKTRLTEDGYPAAAIHYYQADQLDQLSEDLQAILTASDIVLLKASHGIHLEKVLDAIEKKQND